VTDSPRPVLAGKVAIVTGAGQGVGRGIALAFAAEGAVLVLTGRTLSKLDGVAAEVRERGGSALSVVCDITRPEDVRNLVRDAVAEFGGIDILVNNAHETPRGNVALADTPDEDMEAQLQSGPISILRLMRECLPHLVSGGGVVINCAGGVAVDPPAGLGPYAAAKAAVVALTRVAALEWGPLNVRVNAMCAGGMASPAFEEWSSSDPERARQILGSRPLQRMGDAESDAGRVAVFLAGPDSSFITGTLVPVNGGYTYLH
jgi:NAD(P)-dependent dehydrogenase (short-subunit alcohol dehydrogenase family)